MSKAKLMKAQEELVLKIQISINEQNLNWKLYRKKFIENDKLLSDKERSILKYESLQFEMKKLVAAASKSAASTSASTSTSTATSKAATPAAKAATPAAKAASSTAKAPKSKAPKSKESTAEVASTSKAPKELIKAQEELVLKIQISINEQNLNWKLHHNEFIENDKLLSDKERSILKYESLQFEMKKLVDAASSVAPTSTPAASSSTSTSSSSASTASTSAASTSTSTSSVAPTSKAPKSKASTSKGAKSKASSTSKAVTTPTSSASTSTSAASTSTSSAASTSTNKTSKKKTTNDKDSKNSKKSKSEEITTIKSGLLTFAKNSKIYNKIQLDVEEMSVLSYEAAIYISFDVMKKLEEKNVISPKINFLDYFYPLFKDQMKGDKYVISSEYNNFRNDYNLRKYTKKLRSNLFVGMANQYTTIFENNIWMHAYSRVRTFLKRTNKPKKPSAEPSTESSAEPSAESSTEPSTEPSNKDIYLALLYLFDVNPDNDLPSTVVVPTNWVQGHFANLKEKNNLYKSLNDFYFIWSTNKINKWKNFRLTPLFRLGRLHFSYDTVALYQLLCSIEECPKTESPKTGRMINMTAIQFQSSVVYSDYFNLKKNKKYSGSFSTDGVSVSVRYLREQKEPAPPTTLNLEALKDCKDQVWVGIDPGMRLFLGGVRAVGDPYIKENVSTIKYKSAKYYHEFGSSSRKKKLESWTKRQAEIEKTRPAEQTWDEYIKFSLKHMTELQQLYLKRKVCRLRFDNYIRRAETISKVIKDKIVQESVKKVVVCFGDSKQASNSPMKGYIKSPHTKFIKMLKLHPKVIFIPINEYNTTKVCSTCLKKDKHIVSKSPHRFSCCNQCKIVWNRDVNAGMNILKIGYKRLVEGDTNYSIRDV
ncbi:unnamed protein product [Diamesa hyperborea]